MLVDKNEIINRFSEISPEFKAVWESNLQKEKEENERYKEEYGEFYEEEKEERLIYCDIGILARFIVDSFVKDNFENFVEIFELVEELIKNGDEEIEEIMTIGLLESIQNIMLNTIHDYIGIEKWLKEETMKKWKYIEDLWNGEITN